MEEPSLQDSRDDLFYTTTSDIFEYTPYEARGTEYSHPQKFLSVLARLNLKFFGLLKNIFIASLYICIDFTKFIFAYIYHVRTKFVDLVVFLEGLKDGIVKTLMWRRGLLFRPAIHGGVFALAAVAITAGGLFSRGEIAAQDLTLSDSALTTNNTTETIVPLNRPRAEVVKYHVQKGDSLSRIGQKFGISVNTIKWSNDLASQDTIKTGDTLSIPPVTGVVYNVRKGDTVYSVAKKFKADTQSIADFPFNYLDSSFALKTGQKLYVPGGVKVEDQVVPIAGAYSQSSGPIDYSAAGSGILGWPVVTRTINQYFTWWHPAVDLGAPYGSPVFAAGPGRVVDAEKTGAGFGWFIFVDQGNGYIIAYAHLSDIKVNIGQNVTKGQLIGAVGCSGFCTGPHLHLEVRRNGGAVNPVTLF